MKSSPSDAAPDELYAELASLPALGPERLKERWRILYGTEPPTRISEDLLNARSPTGSRSARSAASAFHAPTAPADRRGRTTALVIGHADPQALCGRGSDSGVAGNQPSGDGARGRRAVPRKTPSLTVGGRAQDHRQPLVGAAVLRTQGTRKGKARWNAVNLSLAVAPSTPASPPRRDWSRTLTLSRPARGVRGVHQESARRGLAAGQGRL